MISGGSDAARLELRGITRHYPGVRANDDIDLTVAPGSIHAILGENGAGKSTLMKIIAGTVRRDAGEILWNGREASIGSPADAQRLGIGMVFQHFALFDTLTVAENILLASPPTTKLTEIIAGIAELGDRYGMPLVPGRPIYTMSMGERQQVEIVRALLRHPGLLILDEPTSVLTPHSVKALFCTLRRLAAEGCSILYISHKLDEIRALCDTATILRAGRVTGVCEPRRETSARMARMMIGAEIATISPARPRAPKSGSERLRVQGLSLVAQDPFGTDLHDIALSVRGGEILGIAGIAGNGQDELLCALSGEVRVPNREAITVDGHPVGHLGPSDRRAAGLASAPDDRLGRGAVPSLPLSDNALLTLDRRTAVRAGLIRFGAVRDFAATCIATFDVRGGNPATMAGNLSGGNLQKFIVGRELLQSPGVLIVAQPTWGVDAGAAVAIRQALLDLRRAGGGILVISEDLDELCDIADRIMVLAGGRLSVPFERSRFNREAIGLAMTTIRANDSEELGYAAAR